MGKRPAESEDSCVIYGSYIGKQIGSWSWLAGRDAGLLLAVKGAREIAGLWARGTLARHRWKLEV